MDSKKLLDHFEAVCGSAALAPEYSRLDTERKAAEEQMLYAMQSRRAAVEERKQLRAQKDEAERYTQLVEARAHKRVQHALWQLYHLESTLAQGTSRLDELQAAAQTAEAEQADAKGKAKAARQRMAKVKRERTALEKSGRTSEQSAAKASLKVVEAAENVARLERRLKEQQSGVVKIEADQAQRNKALAGVQAALAAARAELTEASEASAAAAASAGAAAGIANLSPEQLARYHDIKAATMKDLAGLRRAAESARHSAEAEEAQAAAVVQRLAALKDRAVAAEAETAEHVSRKTKLASAIAAARADARSRAGAIASLHQAVSQREAEYQAVVEQLAEVQATLADASAARARNDADAALGAAIVKLQRMFPGVKGRLLELIKPAEPKYALATDVALGKFANAVVVDSADTAKECIAFLRRTRVRPATFLPLDSLRPEEPDHALTQLGPAFRLARDVLVYDDRALASAVAYAVGTTVIADTLPDAMSVRYTRNIRVKLVALDGSVVARNGTMTGGAEPGAAGRTDRWDAAAAQRAEHQKQALLDQEAELRKLVGSRNSSSLTARGSLGRQLDDETRLLDMCNNKIRAIEGQLQRAEETLQARAKEQSNIAEQRAELDKAASAAQERAVAARTAADAAAAALHEQEDSAFAGFCEELGVTSIRAFERTFESEAAVAAAARRNVEERVAKLQQQVVFEQSKLDRLAAGLARAQDQVHLTVQELARVKEAAAEADAAAASAASGQQEYDDAMSKLQDKYEEAEAALGAASVALKQAVQAKARAATEVTFQQGELERCRALRHDMLMKAKLESIDLPVLRGDGSGSLLDGTEDTTLLTSTTDFTPDGASQSQSQAGFDGGKFSQSNAAVVQRDARRAARIDFSALEQTPSATADDAEVAAVAAQYEQELRQLDVELERAQPNMKAMSQFETADARVRELRTTEDSARAAAAAAAAAFQRVQDERATRFFKCYDYVRERVDELYRDITALHTATGLLPGGSASLYLLNEDDPFSADSAGSSQGGIRYSVTPPGKTFQYMQQLSGGEKTMATLALLFALHDYTSAPFFIMDEIDAALDNRNDARVAQFLQRRTSAKDSPLQCILISLKPACFGVAESLVGVFRDQDTGSSGTLTMDLREYATARPSADAGERSTYVGSRVSGRYSALSSRGRQSLGGTSLSRGVAASRLSLAVSDL